MMRETRWVIRRPDGGRFAKLPHLPPRRRLAVGIKHVNKVRCSVQAQETRLGKGKVGDEKTHDGWFPWLVVHASAREDEDSQKAGDDLLEE